jgi:hypothetical protein
MNNYANGEAQLIATSAYDGVHIHALFPESEGHQCVFHAQLDTDSTRTWTVIP